MQKGCYGLAAGEIRNVVPYYNLMCLDGEKEEELLLTIPFTLINKDNMVSQLAVRNEWDNYGELCAYKFPKDINIYGPMQIENRINSDTEISSALTLWGQGGSNVIRGNMMIVPVKDSILYVEPLYMMSGDKSALPELKQVILAYNEKIVMKSSISEVLFSLFGEKLPDGFDEEVTDFEKLPEENNEPEAELTYEEVAKAVIESFKNVKESSSNGNWEDFGKFMTELEKSISELEKETL